LNAPQLQSLHGEGQVKKGKGKRQGGILGFSVKGSNTDISQARSSKDKAKHAFYTVLRNSFFVAPAILII